MPRKKRNSKIPEVITDIDPKQIADIAGLIYIDDKKPGIIREGGKGHFKYRGTDGKIITDKKEIERINSLAIPPAYKNVWICPKPNGHLQATGRDAKGRKQYRYHTKWRETSDETKYNKMLAFAQALPQIRKRVNHDLSLKDLPKEKILAAVVYLLETTLIRVGNVEYARENESYGLTTLRNKHVDVEGQKITFKFKGKSGQSHNISLYDKRLAKIVRRCKDLPGQELFEYLNEKDEVLSITSTDVNEYLNEISGEHFTAKDFRTWAGTVLAVFALQEFQQFDNEAQAKKNIVQAIENVSKRLGNTVTICRKCYIHPEVLNAYLDGSLIITVKRKVEKELAENVSNLSPEEAAVLAFLEKRLAKELEKKITN